MSERSYEQISALPAGITPIDGTELCELEQDGVSRKFPMSTLAGITAEHEAQHQRDGSDPIGSDEVEAYALPYLDASGRIDTRVSDASTTVKGKVQLATDGEEDATKAVSGTDSRLSDARYPTEHAGSHVGGADPIPQATAGNDGLMTSTHVQTLADLSAISFDNIPTADEKAALAGSYGTPSAANVYVTETDPRIESITGIPVGLPVPVCDDAPALESPFEPMNGQLISDAESVFNGRRLRNMNGANVLLDLTFTADAGGAYAEIDEADSPAIGLHDWVIGTGIADNSWINFLGIEFYGTTQTPRNWRGIASHDGDLYAAVGGGDIYKMDGAGVFQPTGQTARNWYGIASHDGDLYAAVDSGDIYKMDGAGVFQPTGQTARNWHALASHDGDLYATVPGGDIYKMDGAGVFQPTGQTARSWYGITSHDGDLYATVPGGDIYKMDGAGVFQPTEQTARTWYAIASHDGDLYATVPGGDIYKMDGAGVFQPTGQTARSWYAIASHDGDLYAAVPGGDIYSCDTSVMTLIISDPSASGAISCTITNEGRGIVGGGFGSVGDQGQRLTGGATSSDDRPALVSSAAAIADESQGSLSFYRIGTGDGPSGSQSTYSIGFDSSGSPNARTSADTWGKTKTDAYKLTYYMRIK